MAIITKRVMGQMMRSAERMEDPAEELESFPHMLALVLAQARVLGDGDVYELACMIGNTIRALKLGGRPLRDIDAANIKSLSGRMTNPKGNLIALLVFREVEPHIWNRFCHFVGVAIVNNGWGAKEVLVVIRVFGVCLAALMEAAYTPEEMDVLKREIEQSRAT